jgi:hypothetical protein
MVKKALAFTLFYVFSSQGMQDSLRISREDIIDEVMLAAKEQRAPSPLVVDNIEAVVTTVLAHEDTDLAADMATAAQHLKRATLLRASDSCLAAIRSNALAQKSITAPIVVLQAIQKELQQKTS